MFAVCAVKLIDVNADIVKEKSLFDLVIITKTIGRCYLHVAAEYYEFGFDYVKFVKQITVYVCVYN